MFDFKSIALKAIHDIGGCNAADEYARGYDEGVKACYEQVSSLAESEEPHFGEMVSRYGDDPRIETIVGHYGAEQKKIMLEEMLELGMAILKLDRGWSEERFQNLKEETADVLIMARQLRVMLGAEEIDSIMDTKIERQLGRIREEKNDEKECFDS